jgi:hypothetical protein
VNEDEPVAWAIIGRATGLVRYVIMDDEEAEALTPFYDVKPLYYKKEKD